MQLTDRFPPHRRLPRQFRARSVSSIWSMATWHLNVVHPAVALAAMGIGLVDPERGVRQPGFRDPIMMIAMPARLTATPIQSGKVGWMPSTHHSQRMATVM